MVTKMYEFNLKLAELIISIKCRFEYTMRACENYILESGSSNFSVFVNDSEIWEEINNSTSKINKGYAEFICIYRKIAEQLPRYNCIVMHGAAITYQDLALLFVAPSGTGKSTHIKLWRQVFQKDVDIINGDKPIVRVDNNKINVYGTPWAGKEGWHRNRTASLKAAFILKQAKTNRITRVNPNEYMSQLLKQIYMPTDVYSLEKTLQLFDIFIKNTAVYILKCNISRDAVKTAYNAIAELREEKSL